MDFKETYKIGEKIVLTEDLSLEISVCLYQ